MAIKLPEELQFLSIGKLPQKTSQESMHGKCCVITGFTSGVGFETALRFAKGGAKLILVARNREKAEKSCSLLKMHSEYEPVYYLADFSDLNQVRKTAETILAHHPRIDILINNAGIHMTTRQLTKDGFECVFAVNHLASFLFTSLLLKRLVQCAPSRIIQVNSEGHRFNGFDPSDLNWEKRRYNGYLSYGASKTAQLLTMLKFDTILKEKSVTINAMHPGAVKSNIGKNNGLLYRLFSTCLIQPFLKKPSISAEALYYLATQPELETVSGKFFNLTHEETPAFHARSMPMSEWMFEKSVTFCSIDNSNYEV